MRNRVLGSWILVGLLVLSLRAAPASAEVTAGISYTVPSGWAAADKGALRILAPSDQRAGELMVVMVVGAQPASGSPEDQVASLAATYNADTKPVGASAVTATDRGAAGKLYVKSFDVENAELGAHTRMLAVLVRGDLRAVILFVFTNNTVLRKHGAAVQELLKSLAIVAKPGSLAAPAVAAAPPASATEGALPTGETPGLYMGTPGWRPSGRGVKIPPVPAVVEGRPTGMWWRYQADASRMFPLLMIYLPDGTHAYNPRFGSGALFDVDGQRKQPGKTGVGTFSVKDGKITQAADGFTQTDAFRSGTDKDGPWFEIGAGRHYPLAQISAKELVGTWRSPSGKYTFRADGTYEGGTVIINREVTAAQGTAGTWQADGYLLAFRPSSGAEWMTSVGRTGSFLVVGQTLYKRE